MIINLRYLLVVCILFACLTDLHGQDFFACYTNIRSGEQFEKHSRVGEFADIMVVIDDQLEVAFWRGSSYLPYLESGNSRWYFNEIIPRSGDGSTLMPDRLNRYSYVRLIESTDEKIVVHWRYVPDFGNPTFTGVVDEYFTITSDGKVVRSVRKGTATIDEWEGREYEILQVLELNPNGIEEISLTTGHSGNESPEQKPDYRPVEVSENDLIRLPFNESAGVSTHELVNDLYFRVEGHKILWKEGVAGSCLQFDGYYSATRLPGHLIQDVEDEMRVEGWVALGAYPFDWGPVVHQSTWEHSGFYLGVDRNGKAGFHVTINGTWLSVVSEIKLDLFRWYHLAGSVDKKGEIRLFVDERLAGSAKVETGKITLSNSDIVVGLNSEKMPAGPGRIRMGKYPSLFGIDGLIDEVRISAKSGDSFEDIDAVRPLPDMNPRHWPVTVEDLPAGFGAHYTKLQYYETWDNMWRVSDHPDVVVTFDELPGRIISWRGLSNGPVLVTENNLWVGDQSSENYKEMGADDAEGCCEHMSDKQCRHAHIRIIENTGARVVLHYRYGMVDSRYIFPDVDPETGWGDWADEVWTIYPDGVAVRYLERGMIWGDSWVETMFFSAPGQQPEDVVELEAFTLVHGDGEKETLSWENDSPVGEFEGVVVTMVNTKSKYKAFNIYPTDSDIEIFSGHSRFSHFHWWNHWPVSQITSDGRGARAADRAAHSSLVWGIPSEPFLMYGITDKPASELMDLANSWNDPPEISNIRGALNNGYKQNQRAYQLARQGREIKFNLSGSEETPILNPCFVVKNWESEDHAQIIINGREPEGIARQGILRDTDGSGTLVIWLKLVNKNITEIEISD